MEIIGDPKNFAVQLEWDRSELEYKPWMYGVFCVFICGEIIGSLLNQVTLNGILAELHGWRESYGERCEPALMAADTLTAFLSIENANYELEHLQNVVPKGFSPVTVQPSVHFEILNVDGLENYRLYCVENETTSRLLYAKATELPRECLVPRTMLTHVLNETIEKLDEWFAQLPEPPPSS